MDFNSALDLIIRELREAEEIIESLKVNDNLSRISIELAKSKCRNAASTISLLRELQAEAKSPEAVSQKVDTDEAVVTQQPVSKEQDTKGIAIEIQAEKFSEKEAEPEFVIEPETETEPEMEIKPEISIEPEKVSAGIKSGSVIVAGEPEVKESQRKGSSIIADSFGTADNRINEKLGKKPDDRDYSDVLINKPFRNLSKAIGVNDKFLFIREIFKSDPAAYERVTGMIDNASTYTEASAIFNEYKGNRPQTDIDGQFLAIVKRKFAH